MENIRPILIGNGNLSSLGNVSQKGNTEAEEKTSASAQNNSQTQVSGDKYFEAYNIQGNFNKQQILQQDPIKQALLAGDWEGLVKASENNLGIERSADIASSQVNTFEPGVEDCKSAVSGEVPDASEAVKNQIAAEMFARGLE